MTYYLTMVHLGPAPSLPKWVAFQALDWSRDLMANHQDGPVSKSSALLVALLRFGYIRSIAHSKMSPKHDIICLGWHRKYMIIPFYCIDVHMSTHNPFLQHIWPKAWWFVVTSPSRSARIRTQSSSQRSVQTGSSLNGSHFTSSKAMDSPFGCRLIDCFVKCSSGYYVQSFFEESWYKP